LAVSNLSEESPAAGAAGGAFSFSVIEKAGQAWFSFLVTKLKRRNTQT
jgi:hypothetical protein